MNKIKFFLTLIALLALSGCGSETEPIQQQDVEASEDGVDETELVEDAAEEKKTETEPEIVYADVLQQELPGLTDEYLELSDASYQFISENDNLFPAKTDEDIEAAKSKSEDTDIKLLNKNVQPFVGKITSYEGYVVQIEEANFENGETASFVNIYDETVDANHTFYMYKGTGDILEEDYVRFWGAPIGKYAYETLDGGYQNALFFFGSHIEKVQ